MSRPGKSLDWNDTVVRELNELQIGVRYGHPYTCPNRSDGNHHTNGNDVGCLLATPEGWICPSCNYTQDWHGNVPPKGNGLDAFLNPSPTDGGPKTEKSKWTINDTAAIVFILIMAVICVLVLVFPSRPSHYNTVDLYFLKERSRHTSEVFTFEQRSITDKNSCWIVKETWGERGTKLKLEIVPFTCPIREPAK